MFKFQPLTFRGVYCINHLQTKNSSSSSWHICQYFKLSLSGSWRLDSLPRRFEFTKPTERLHAAQSSNSRLHKKKFHRIRCYSIIIKTQKLPSFSPRQTLTKSKAPTKSNLQTILSHVLKHKKSSTQAPKPRKPQPTGVIRWHQPNLHALLFSGNLSKLPATLFSINFDSPPIFCPIYWILYYSFYWDDSFWGRPNRDP